VRCFSFIQRRFCG